MAAFFYGLLHAFSAAVHGFWVLGSLMKLSQNGIVSFPFKPAQGRRPRWVLGSGFWVLGSGFWVLGSGFWVLGSGFWVLGSGFWVLGSGTTENLAQ